MVRIKVKAQSAIYHLYNRFVFRAFLFDDRAKEVFIRILHRQARFCGLEVVTYCVMDNHFHLLVRVPEKSPLSDGEILERYKALYGGPKIPVSALRPEELQAILSGGGEMAATLRAKLLARMNDVSVFMKELKQRFTIWYNHHSGNTGTLWSETFRSTLIEAGPHGGLISVAMYIDLNPVRAGLVESPRDYRWCGYAQGAVRCEILTSETDRAKAMILYGQNLEKAAVAISAFLKAQSENGLEKETRPAIFDCFAKIRSARIIGTTGFKAQFSRRIQRAAFVSRKDPPSASLPAEP